MKTVLKTLACLAPLALSACHAPGHRAGVDIGDWSLAATPLDRSAAALRAATGAHLAAAQGHLDQILAVQAPRTVDNTLVPYNDMLMHIDAASQECGLFSAVHPDEATREAGEAGGQDVSSFISEISLSRELYDALASIDLSQADALTNRVVANELDDFRRAGVNKDEQTRARIKELNEELTRLGQDWSRNIAEDTRSITVDSVAALQGLPEDWIANHAPGDDGLITINTTYPDYVPVMRYADDAETRERLYLVYNNRAFPQNAEVLREVLDKRYELARLLGFENYADYVTDDKMIGSPENAHEFIDRIAALTVVAVEREREALLEAKRRSDPGASNVADWEKGYLANKVREERFDFDPQSVRPYFNFPAVQAGLFELTGRMFGVRYEQVEGLDLWHEDVTAWDLWDGDDHVGRFYLDLHPRENKYQHAACFGYRDGVEGKRLPQATLVCNFPNPRDSDDGVALMEHSQVTTFFHEFGHLLHALFGGHQEWMPVSGIATEWDFVEAPSQMLEEWCFDVDALSVFAHDYETGEPIPPELVGKLRLADDFGKGSNTAHQMFYAALSLNYYDNRPEDVDLMAMLTDLQSRYSPYPHVEGTHFNTSFGHLYGYSAIYYTYMWSQVIAKDLYSRFEAEGPLNPDTARSYRRAVLEAGGSLPAAELVEEFLGRPYSFEAFERWLNETPDVGGPTS